MSILEWMIFIGILAGAFGMVIWAMYDGCGMSKGG
jgi:hypothetical protein